MDEIVITMNQLRGMIGVPVEHEGIPCRVVEVLEDGPSLVLEALARKEMQPDQHGDPRRHVPETYVVPVLDHDRDTLHPEFLALDLVDTTE